jgi:putative spermidine/putrescine transport system permease protein
LRRSPGRLALGGLTWAVVIYMTMPLLVTIPLSLSSVARISFPPPGLSLQWYEDVLGLDRGGSIWTRAAFQSLQVGIATSLLATALGSLAAIPIARLRFRGKSLLETFLLLPLVLPSVVLASGILLLYLPTGLMGTTHGLVLAHTVLATPYVLLIVASGLRGFDERLEWAGLGLGAGRIKVFWTVTLPIVRPAVIVGAFFAFLTSFDELVIAMFVADNRAPTLPRLLWDFVLTETTPVIAAVSSLLFLLSLGFVAVAALTGRDRTSSA